jgi:tetratricopeptide (TPR) repeat protein
MATLSTLSTLPPSRPTPQPPALVAVQTVWDHYFAARHTDVLNAATQALFAAHAPDYLHICGLSLIAGGRLADGIVLLRAALLLYPQAPSWFANGAIATLNAGAAQDALDFALSGLARHDDAILHFAHGNALMHLNRLDEAQAPFLRALALKPDLADAKLNLGNVHRRLGRTTEALSLYNQVLARDPGNGLAMINRAGVLIELNEHDEAAMLLLRIMATSEMPEVSFMMAMLRLIDGDFHTGFDLYRARFDCAMAAPDKAQFRQPLISDLTQAKTRHVLVSHEQGFGDSLQFIRYLPLFAAVAQQVTLLVPPSLHRLFADVDPRVRIVADRDAVGAYDLECPMLTLPFLFKTTVETIPATIPYLAVPAAAISANALGASPRQRVGLVWAGQMRSNPDLAAVDRRRSLSLVQLAPLLSIKTLDFISLQMGDPAAQIYDHALDSGRPREVLDTTMDFADTAAIILQLDLVITVDTAVAHLAAALGKPVWVLSRFDQCWRWLKGRDDSPWYPGVLRLFRQETRGDWAPTLVALKAALEIWADEIGAKASGIAASEIAASGIVESGIVESGPEDSQAEAARTEPVEVSDTTTVDQTR